MARERWSRRGFMVTASGVCVALLAGACGASSSGPENTGGTDPLASLSPGEGAVLDVDGKKVAAYRTDGGELIKLSPKCPHQGCDVVWNSAEKRWDCPCHASQFSPEGELLKGPAGEGLAKAS